MTSDDKNIMDPAVNAELERLDDGVPFRATRGYTHSTWARTFHSSPELYIRPQSVEEIQKAITLARRCRKHITTVGCGHSPSEMTCTSSWMINLDDFNKIIAVDKEKCVVTMQAGIRLYQLGEALDKQGLAMPNLGSINQQSIAGAISTGTHGSSLIHNLVSSSILSLKITLANSRTVLCSPDQNAELFRAALLSLGALGIITEISFQAVPAFTLHWQQAVYKDSHMLKTWDTTLWKQAEFVRVWWFPYTRRSTIWHASKTDRPPSDMPYKASFYEGALGYHVYHNLLWVAHYIPRILPWVEWFVFGMQYGFGTGEKTKVEAIQPSRQALLMNCLYSQFVNEWAIPISQGPIALRRLSSWLNQLRPSDPDYVEHGIPFSAKGLYVHAPVEVRISNTNVQLKNQDGTPRTSPRPYLDPTSKTEPTLYLNATLYRPYGMDPPCHARYYQGFEYLMKELGGKPHWAKNFDTTSQELEEMYKEDMIEFRKVRDEADPEGMFVGPWQRKYILPEWRPRYVLEEAEVGRENVRAGGIRITGALSVEPQAEDAKDAKDVKKTEGKEDDGDDTETEKSISRPSSQSSFDVMHTGEAEESQVLPPHDGDGVQESEQAPAEEAIEEEKIAKEVPSPLAVVEDETNPAERFASYEQSAPVKEIAKAEETLLSIVEESIAAEEPVTPEPPVAAKSSVEIANEESQSEKAAPIDEVVTSKTAAPEAIVKDIQEEIHESTLASSGSSIHTVDPLEESVATISTSYTTPDTEAEEKAQEAAVNEAEEEILEPVVKSEVATELAEGVESEENVEIADGAEVTRKTAANEEDALVQEVVQAAEEGLAEEESAQIEETLPKKTVEVQESAKVGEADASEEAPAMENVTAEPASTAQEVAPTSGSKPAEATTSRPTTSSSGKSRLSPTAPEFTISSDKSTTLTIPSQNSSSSSSPTTKATRLSPFAKEFVPTPVSAPTPVAPKVPTAPSYADMAKKAPSPPLPAQKAAPKSEAVPRKPSPAPTPAPAPAPAPSYADIAKAASVPAPPAAAPKKTPAPAPAQAKAKAPASASPAAQGPSPSTPAEKAKVQPLFATPQTPIFLKMPKASTPGTPVSPIKREGADNSLERASKRLKGGESGDVSPLEKAEDTERPGHSRNISEQDMDMLTELLRTWAPQFRPNSAKDLEEKDKGLEEVRVEA